MGRGPADLRILTWNTQRAGPETSERQANWLAGSGADILVLTEADGLHNRLVSALCEHGFRTVESPTPPQSLDEHLILAARGYDLDRIDLPPARYQPHRCLAAELTPPPGGWPLVLAGLYVPARGGVSRRHNDKRAFRQAGRFWLPQVLDTAGDRPVIVAGDLRALEPGEIRRYEEFGPWECDFFWSFARMGLVDVYRAEHLRRDDGPRWFGVPSEPEPLFEHLFITGDHAERVRACDRIADESSGPPALYADLSRPDPGTHDLNHCSGGPACLRFAR